MRSCLANRKHGGHSPRRTAEAGCRYVVDIAPLRLHSARLGRIKQNAFTLRPRNLRGGGTVTCLHACRLPPAGERGADECDWTVRGGQSSNCCFAATHGRASVCARGRRQPGGGRTAAGTTCVLRTDGSGGPGFGGEPPGARCVALPESVAAS